MGMFGNSGPQYDPTGGATYGGIPLPSAGAPISLASPTAAPAPAAHQSFFGAGGTGRSIAGYIGDALLSASGHSPMYAPMVAQQRNQQAQQQQELQRQMQLAQFKRDNPEPTPMQRNYQYLQGLDPKLAESYIRAEANPMTLMTDPTTGNLSFQPKGGYAPNQAPTSKVVNGKTYYQVNGDWYDNPEGR